MGISSNQARFLALTSRQVDLEFRIQQICQRRLRLATELENTATSYNNQISNRHLYTTNSNNSGISQLTIDNIQALRDENGNTYEVLGYYNSGGSMSVGVEYNSESGLIEITAGGSVQDSISRSDLGLAADATESDMVDVALRAGLLQIAATPDVYTQSVTSVSSGGPTNRNVEIKDWRTIPAFVDELYKSDDVDAQNEYEKTISEINAQDKKLQLEQTSIEVEYKAVSSEKESVKKVLDTNAQTSFKYFS